MVQTTGIPAARQPSPFPKSAITGRGMVVRFTVRDVEVMLEQGILPEDATTELLNGVIVRKDRADLGDEPNVIGQKHRLVVNKLTNLAGLINLDRQHIQIQNPVLCGEDQAPEPDFAIVRGSIDAYAERSVTGADTSCVVEVADSSLERDVEEKRPIYAAASVSQYVVINLRNRTAIVWGDVDPVAGQFRSEVVVPEGGELRLTLSGGDHFLIRLADLLP